ncbi:MAG TPA: hypothetical protein VF002_04775 [Gaiellaceae bacterium]
MELFPLAVREEDGEIVVGRVDTGVFVSLPSIGSDVIRALERGLSIEEAEAEVETIAGESVDVAEFAATLVDLGFVDAIDRQRLQTAAAAAPTPTFPWLKPNHVDWLYARPFKLCYLALLATGVVAVASHPRFLPHPAAFFWSPRISLVIGVNFLLFLTALAIHEFFHLASARSLGIPARIGLGTRLHHLVAQTDVTGLWSLPRRARRRVYIAGIAWDSALLATTFILLAYGHLPPLGAKLLQALGLVVFFGVASQFLFYMRTDLYFVILDSTRTKNLFADAMSYLSFVRSHLCTLTRDPSVASRADHIDGVVCSRWRRFDTPKVAIDNPLPAGRRSRS